MIDATPDLFHAQSILWPHQRVDVTMHLRCREHVQMLLRDISQDRNSWLDFY